MSINWAKPVLIGGAHETFKLAGTLNDKQLVVTTDSNGTQSLFVVDEAGESYLLNSGYPTLPPRGPKFTNEPEVFSKATRYLNIYEDGRIGVPYPQRVDPGSGCIGCLKIDLITFTDKSFSSVTSRI